MSSSRCLFYLTNTYFNNTYGLSRNLVFRQNKCDIKKKIIVGYKREVERILWTLDCLKPETIILSRKFSYGTKLLTKLRCLI